MVVREVPFVGTFSILYSWKNIDAFFKAYGLKNMEDFQTFWQPENSGKLGLDDFVKIISFGLQRRDKTVDIETVQDLLDNYSEDHTLQDVIELIITAQMAALVTQDEGEAKGEVKNPRKTSTK